ncbi:MAG: phage tail protein [Cyanobacteria bacterium P01_D01_bin.36]
MPAPQTSQPVEHGNYVTSNRFYVEIESSLTAAFAECTGLGVQISKETLSEGGMNEQQRILLGAPQFSDITLKRGTSGSQVFWNWLNALFQPRTAGEKIKDHRRNVNILVFNQAGETQQCWTLIGAVPVGWQAPSLQADGNSVAIEELTLAYEGISVAFGGNGGGATILSGRSETGYFASR